MPNDKGQVTNKRSAFQYFTVGFSRNRHSALAFEIRNQICDSVFAIRIRHLGFGVGI
jgi:hypothetical protein